MIVVEFTFLRGAQAGRTERFERAVITIGRHPSNDLAFDAERDLDASSHHAEVRVHGDGRISPTWAPPTAPMSTG